MLIALASKCLRIILDIHWSDVVLGAQITRTFSSFSLPKLSRKKKRKRLGSVLRIKCEHLRWQVSLGSWGACEAAAWRNSFVDHCLVKRSRDTTMTWRTCREWMGPRQMAEPCAYSGWYPMAWDEFRYMRWFTDLDSVRKKYCCSEAAILSKAVKYCKAVKWLLSLKCKAQRSWNLSKLIAVSNVEVSLVESKINA